LPATIDARVGKTHLTWMSVEIRLSSKGQIVIPKDVRDALHLAPGTSLRLSQVGRRIVIEACAPQRERIDYAEFRRRVPCHRGPAATIDDMNAAIDRMIADSGRP
jgi:AbrB family looped-hinge helix DNA binding protein